MFPHLSETNFSFSYPSLYSPRAEYPVCSDWSANTCLSQQNSPCLRLALLRSDRRRGQHSLLYKLEVKSSLPLSSAQIRVSKYCLYTELFQLKKYPTTVSVSDHPQCWCSWALRNGMIYAWLHFSGFFAMFVSRIWCKTAIMKPCRPRKIWYVFTCSHFHFLSAALLLH